MTLTPRLHNVVSYGVAWLLFPIAAITMAIGLLEQGIPDNAVPSFLLPMCLWCFHFARRASEAFFVHRYSKPRFAWGDALIEYAYYWGFGLWIAYAMVKRSAEAPPLDTLGLVGLLLFFGAEIANARCHWMLRNLRANDPVHKAIPRGFAFEWLSCPHYLFEILSWVGFALVARTVAAAVFALVGAGILVAWATVRHRAYKQTFDGKDGKALYPPQRKAILPFIY